MISVHNPNNLKLVKISELKPLQGNLKDLSTENYNKLKNSLIKHGFNFPVFVWNGYLIDGHQRQRVMLKENWDLEIPVVEIQAENVEDAKEQLLKATSQYGKITIEGLDEFMPDWQELDVNFDAITFTDLGEEKPEIIEDEVPEPPEEPKTVLGDLYEIGEHRLLCGDSTDSDQVAKLMNGSKADMVFTDPPYRYKKMGSGGIFNNGFEKLKEDIKDIVNFDPTEFLKTLPLVFSKGINAYIFCNTDLVPDYCIWAKENKFNFNILTWHKKSFIPASNNHHFPDTEYLIYISKSAIFNSGLDVNYGKYFIIDNEKSDDHPTIKPLEIISNEIKIGSNINSLVFDFFLGSGSTMVAAHQLKRKCYGIELDPKYCDVIVTRMLKIDPTLKVKRNGEEIVWEI